MSSAKKIRKALKLALAKNGDGDHTHNREQIEAHPVYVASRMGLLLRFKITYRSVGLKSMARFARRHGIKPNQVGGLFDDSTA